MPSRITESLKLLTERRPVFHSEADLQFALAWIIRERWVDSDVRLEIPLASGNDRFKLDMLVRFPNERVAVELKYFKAAASIEHQSELFRLSDAAARDEARYDFCKDIMRVEKIVQAGLADAGLVLALTNEPAYWKPALGASNIDYAFRLEEGRNLSGTLDWASHAGGTKTKRPHPIVLCGTYVAEWHDYHSFESLRNGHFRFLALAVSGSSEAPLAEVVVPQIDASFQSRVRASKYDRLASVFTEANTDDLSMSFAEIDALVGGLPKSARAYREWWANHAQNPQAVWLTSGFAVAEVSIGTEQVRFVKGQGKDGTQT